MLSEEHISLSHYFTLGIRLFILSGILFAIYVNYFAEPIHETINYIESDCVINTINITKVTIDCVDFDHTVNLVDLPCVVVRVDTNKQANILFYRNFNEKRWAKSKSVNCSYLPMHCKNDPKYTERLLSSNYLKLFPPRHAKFKCYLPKSSNNTSETQYSYYDSTADALLFVPDKLAYQCSLYILVFGVLIGLSFVIFGLKFEIKYPLNSTKIINNYLKDIHVNTFNHDYSILKLNQLISRYSSYKNKSDETSVSVDENEAVSIENIELMNFSLNQKNNLTISDNISRNRSLSHEDFRKLSNAGYHVGRVGYPSCSKLSVSASIASLRSSHESICHSIKDVGMDDSDRSYDGPIFYLDIKRNASNNDRSSSPDPNYHNIHIPQSIVEEDENSVTVSSINDIKSKNSRPSIQNVSLNKQATLTAAVKLNEAKSK